MSEWITVHEAAEILGVHLSAIPKMIRRGDLKRRERRPILSRSQVVALHDARAARVQESLERVAPGPPDQEHDWLTAPEAGELMGVGAEAVRVRARRGRLPSELHDGRRWFRRDHLELVKQADQVKRAKHRLVDPHLHNDPPLQLKAGNGESPL